MSFGRIPQWSCISGGALLSPFCLSTGAGSSNISGLFPSQAFDFICATLHMFQMTPHVTEQRNGREKKEGEDVFEGNVIFLVCPTNCLQKVLADASDPVPRPCLSATSSVEKEYLTKDLSLAGRRGKYFLLAGS